MEPAESVMRTPPIRVSSGNTVSDVVERMLAQNIGAVIVVSGPTPVGIITERDILERVVKARREVDATKAGDVMSAPIVTIESNRPIRDALQIMYEKRIRRLAVTKGVLANIVGIVTERRILDLMAAYTTGAE